MKKKLLVLLLFAIMIISIPISATTLYETLEETQISTGTTLKNYKRFTEKGWLNINVLEIDLKDRYTDITLLTSSDGVGKTQNLKTMATNNNCIAAINGDFFAANSGKGHSMGIAINDNELISSSYSGNLTSDSFATFLLDNKSNPFYEFISNTITLTSKKTKESIEVSEINKYPDSYNVPAIYTKAFGEYSIGSKENLEMTEVVVANNKVTEVRTNQEAVQIPKNGYVISATGEGAEFLTQNFKVGTRVDLNVETSFNIKNIKFAISGGALLIKDGEIPETFSSNITGTHPRTAIGTSKDGETLYLITVDGRQTSSIGMTQQELAEFLLEIDVYNAINLDGGGSTTMVAQNLGDSFLSTINSPSGDSLRAIINGIGVTNNAPSSSKPYRLIIEIDDTNIFSGMERKITVKGYNKYYSPIEIDQDDIKWSYNGVPVEVKDGIITGDTVGTTNLTATYKKVKATIEINILSNPNEISISPKETTIDAGKSTSFYANVKNKNGYYANVDNANITWKIEEYFLGEQSEEIPNDAKFENGIFTATTPGSYIVSASINEIKSFALINIKSEENTTYIQSVPHDIKGSDELNQSAELENEDSFTISVFDEITDASLMIENLRNKKIVNSINKNANVAIFTSQNDNEMLKNITSNVITCEKYNLTTYKNSTFIAVNALNNGIRNTDSTQWTNLQNDIKDSESENIFIVMNTSLDNFSDSAEAKLFIDVLCELKRETSKNIWVLHKGTYTDYSMERGIKYLGINTKTSTPNDILTNTNYFLITVNSNKLTYEIKNVF